MKGYVAGVGYIACIPAANWLIGHVGSVCLDHGPCLVPVAPGLMAPSGVLLIGAALVLRDAVQSLLGLRAVFFAIAAGTVLSFALATPGLVVASGAAFLLGELADMLVYQPLHERRLLAAVALSSVAGAIVDSVVFLWLAFGSVQFIAGQVIGKLLMMVLAIPIIAMMRKPA